MLVLVDLSWWEVLGYLARARICVCWNIINHISRMWSLGLPRKQNGHPSECITLRTLITPPKHGLKVTGYRAGVVFLSTSTASSYCTVALSELKTTQYGASHTGKHFKRREIRNSRGCGVTEAATKRFFSSGIWTCAKDPAPPLTVTVRSGHL